ncbi:MAG: DinB family protein [Chloroflexi bacterium]|nr:MAG: DinB family protein [Chloroflexota bacterium]
MDEAGVRTVGDAFKTLFHELHDKLREQVRGLDQGTLNWRPLPKANSIAVLVTHSLGSEREMIRAVRSVASDRDRDSEFKVEAEAADLLGLLDQADRELDEHLAGLTVEDLTQDRPRKDQEPKRGLLWLISNYGHAREHLAQIELTKQLYDSRT